MTTSTLAVSSLLTCAFLSVSYGMTIYETIFNAVDDVEGFDLMADIDTGTVRTELDMMLLKEQYEALTKEDGHRHKRKARKNERYRWPKNVIPYLIDTNAFRSSKDKAEIRKAMDEWETYTCIQFRQKNSYDDNFVNFKDARGCYSYVGMIGGAQTIGLAGGCRQKGVIVHEIGHAVGFHHEQNRPDRDDHVRIMRQNIPENVYYNFKKYSRGAVDTYDVPYDYTSVMHYSGRAFSVNGDYTIRTIDPKHQKSIGNRYGLSFNDVKLANLMYKCCDKTSVRCKDKDSFVGKDCKCWCRSKDNSPARQCDSAEVTDPPSVSTTPAPTTIRPKCADMNPSCPAWSQSKRNYCQTNTYVQSYCKKSCGTCESEPKKETCLDKSTHCKDWQQEGYCTGQYESIMTTHCPKSCNRCGSIIGQEGENSGLVNCPSVLLTIFLISLLNTVL